PRARKALEETAHQPALEVFRLAREEYFPKLRDEKTRKEASAVLRDKITPAYRRHSNAMQEAAKEVEASTKAAEADVATSIRTWSNTTIVLSIVVLLTFGALGWLIVGSILKSTRQLNERVRQMAS